MLVEFFLPQLRYDYILKDLNEVFTDFIKIST